MGYALIFWVYEDALRHHEKDAGCAAEIGEQVLSLYRREDDGYPNRPLGDSSPGICLAARLHSTWTNVLVWSGNRLALPSQLKAREEEPVLKELKEGIRVLGEAWKRDVEVWEGDAATRLWALFTSNRGRLSPFEQRLVEHLPRNMMHAFSWGDIGAPRNLDELREALLEDAQAVGGSRAFRARGMLYSYLAEYEDTVARLRPPADEDLHHLEDIARLALAARTANLTTKLDEDKDMLSMVSMLVALLESRHAEGSPLQDLRGWLGENSIFPSTRRKR